MAGAVDSLRQDLDDRARAALAWWLGELRDLLPRRGGQAARQAPVALEFAGDAVRLRVHPSGGGRPVVAAIDPSAPDAAAAQVQAALRQCRRASGVTIELQPDTVLETELNLPRAAERALRQILANQMERIVPLPPDEVEFAHAVLPRRGGGEHLRVRLTVATKATIAQALDLARRLRLRPERVVAGAGGGQPPAVLWRSDRDEAGRPLQRRLRDMLELGAVGLLVAAFAFYVIRLDQQAESLQQLAADKGRLAQAAMKLARQRETTEAALAMLQKRRAEPAPLQILNELTILVPENSWVSRVQVQGQKVEIVGVSPNVSKLVDSLNRDQLFANPKFLSPITGTEDGKAQRFDISMDIVTGVAADEHIHDQRANP
ncbi:PilN domain-containing protein [Marinibaculum pumilum]|uniref:PilN domain-containing protein n=1 Tax=Marinibaculum pumilum TaxID=1766165 RepID=A0ABV7L1A3_9PROT